MTEETLAQKMRRLKAEMAAKTPQPKTAKKIIPNLPKYAEMAGTTYESDEIGSSDENGYLPEPEVVPTPAGGYKPNTDTIRALAIMVGLHVDHKTKIDDLLTLIQTQLGILKGPRPRGEHLRKKEVKPP